MEHIEHVVSLFKKPVMQLPRCASGDFLSRVQAAYEGYLTELRSRSDPWPDALEADASEIVTTTEELCESIESAIRAARIGRHLLASTKVKEALDRIRESVSMRLLRFGPGDRLDYLFRMRSMTDKKVSRGKLFHIPFEQRHVCGKQRYSVDGVPCLYLGGSLYTSWLELGQPEVSSCQVVRFSCEKTDLKILDLGLTPRGVAAAFEAPLIDTRGQPLPPDGQEAILNDAIKQVGAYLRLWPLIAACSFKVLYADGHFKEEYTVSSLLLNLIAEDESVDGLCYFTTKTSEWCTEPGVFANYVFPVRTWAESGYCANLRENFALTEPVNWEYAELTALELDDEFRRGRIYRADGSFFDYLGTGFHEMERRLWKLPEQRV